MDEKLRLAIINASANEPFARHMGLNLTDLGPGFSVVEMDYRPEHLDNIYQRAHGGAIYGLIDEAFQAACQTHGTIAVALNVNVSYVTSPDPGARLRAEARETSRSKKIAHYDITVTDENADLIATCRAMAFRTDKPIPFYQP